MDLYPHTRRLETSCREFYKDPVERASVSAVAPEVLGEEMSIVSSNVTRRSV
jgi:hypothetical protein